MSRWFRWYEGTTEDGKFRLVARKSRVTVRDVLALWAVMLEDAADLSHAGVCSMRFDLMEATLDMDEGMARTIVDQMASIGMVSGSEGDLTVCNWSKRQFKSDVDETAAERQKRKRERDKQNVTRDSGASHAALDTDTDTEKKKEPARSRDGFDEEFDQSFWPVYPLRKGRGQALRAFRAVRKSGIPLETLVSGAQRYRDDPERKPNYTRHGATWLNGEGWKDEPAVAPPIKFEPAEVKEASRHMAYAALISKGISPGLNFSSVDRRKMIAAGLVTQEQCERAGCAA